MQEKTAAKQPIPKADKYIWAIYIFILLVSVVELYSASSREVTGSNVMGPLLRHGRLLLLGVGITWLVSRVKYKWFITITPLVACGALLLGVYVLFKGDIINGARRSITIAGIALQSAEILKFTMVLMLAYLLSRTQVKGGGVSKGGVLGSALFMFICCLILYSQGTTNTLLIVGIALSMMLIGGMKWRWFFVIVLCMGLAFGAYQGLKGLTKKEYSPEEQAYILEHGVDLSGNAATLDRDGTRKSRFRRWWHGDSIPKYEQEITSQNRQEMYSYMAQANGGIVSLPGNSRETSRLPLAFSDYIFAIVVEDLGLVGGLVLLGFYLALLARAGAIAGRCERAFPALLVMGMAVMIVLQALFHMAIVTGVFPVSGQPLPLISKGGSSILVTSLAFGMMLSVSRWAVTTDASSREIRAEAQELPAEMSAENPGKF